MVGDVQAFPFPPPPSPCPSLLSYARFVVDTRQEALQTNRQRVAIYSIYSATRKSPLPKIAGIPILLGRFLEFIEHQKGRTGLRVTTEKGSMEESKTVRERVLEPGRVLSLHSDNGSEFMNGHLVRFCHTRGITFTRSRPYHKNDNAHVEENNNSVIRKFVGYDRHDTQEEVDLLNRLYKALHLLVNWFLPSQKLLHKVRTGSHITKVYDRAQTPCARMLARMDVPEETKKRLRSTCAELDLTSLETPLGLARNNWTRLQRGDNPW